ncbi:hypothetical protein GCM10023075_39000 [Streptosporangium album]
MGGGVTPAERAEENAPKRMGSPVNGAVGVDFPPVKRDFRELGAPRFENRGAPTWKAVGDRCHHRLSAGLPSLFRGARLLSVAAAFPWVTAISVNTGARPLRHGPELITAVDPAARGQMTRPRAAPRPRLSD